MYYRKNCISLLKAILMKTIFRKNHLKNMKLVKVLTGVRRCGKSTILKMIMEELQNERGISADQIVFMRFDSMEYEDMTAKQMFEAVKLKLSENKKTYFFLDEVQEIEG